MDNEKSRLEEIKDQIKKLDLSTTFFVRREIKELPDILAENENIIYLVEGRNTANNNNGILVATDRRVIFVDKEFLYGLKVEAFPLDKINSLQYETSLVLGIIKIHTSGKIVEINGVGKHYARQFCETVTDFMSRSKQEMTNNSEPTVLDQLEQLGKLKDNGVLTEEEFNEQKKKLINRL
ncbi:hypothetical protein M2347_003747 [Chryseobacterium sp. H1D6B]|uniref:PH domain-containing protein n=1 Tax=Chryseobacterium sp. H1D6B TaxID=2940588 RepID=UPI0015CDDFD7|nr:PH domain-containing protein [Chryseobacterium sp. H1D6B]MDH6254020.1 hypothetical protein [Chryseobacterium sp. H1D6B]